MNLRPSLWNASRLVLALMTVLSAGAEAREESLQDRNGVPALTSKQPKPEPPRGTGTGLTGAYYTGQTKTFDGKPTLVRVDSTIDFDWEADPPDTKVARDFFTVRWTGWIEPRFSESYTFSVLVDDGIRVWIDGQLIIDSWQDQWANHDDGYMQLKAGKKYKIVVEYYEKTGESTVRVGWSSLSEPRGAIPQSQLYPGEVELNPRNSTVRFISKSGIKLLISGMAAAMAVLFFLIPGRDDPKAVLAGKFSV